MNRETSIVVAPDEMAVVRAKSRLPRLLLLLIVPLLLLAAGGYVWWSSRDLVETDNAQVRQDITSVGSQVGGPIAQVFVKEGQRVRAGQLLFTIDDAPYRVALLAAEAQLSAATMAERQVVSFAAGTGADISGAEAQLTIMRRALDRQAELLERGFTTRVRYDEALSDLRQAETALADARARSNTAAAAIAPSGEQPGEAAARAAIAKARLDLDRAQVRAPAAGTIANLARLLPGQQAVPGIGLLSLVGGGAPWIEANFKEGDLARMSVGQRVEVEIDAFPGTALRGRVTSIGAGTGAQFAILPAQNANGNWVKVTQRVPVRITLDRAPERAMIAGLSATVTVDVAE